MYDKDSLMLETLYESIYVDVCEVLLEAVDKKTAVNTVVKRGNVPIDVAEYLYDLSNKYCLWIANQLNKKKEFKDAPNEQKLAFIQQNLEEEMEKVLRFLEEGSKFKNFNVFQHTWEEAVAENFEKYHKKTGGNDSVQFVDYVKEKFPNIYQFFFKQVKAKGGIKDFEEIPDKSNWFKMKFEFPDDEKAVEEFLKTEMGRHYFWTAKTIKEMPEYQQAANKLPFVRSLDQVTVNNQLYANVFHNIAGWLDSPSAPNPYSIKPLVNVTDRNTGQLRPDETVWQRAAKLADHYMVENAPGAGYLELPMPGDFSEEYKRTNREYQEDIRDGGSSYSPYMKGQDFPLGEVIKTYPNGFFWVDTQVNSKKLFDRRSRESLLVNHCGSDTSIRDPDTGENVYEGSSLFSLRKVVDVPVKDARGKPVLDEEGSPTYEKKIKGFLTFTGNPSHHLWYQLKCKGNSSLYSDNNKFLIPYVVDIMVQLGLWKEGYPDFKLTTIVDEIKANPERYKDAGEYMKTIKKQHGLKLLKDKVEQLARNFNSREFDNSDDDVKEAYIELGYEIPNDESVSKLSPELQDAYLKKVLESPKKSANYILKKFEAGYSFDNVEKEFLKTISKDAEQTVRVVLAYLRTHDDDFSGVPKGIMTGLAKGSGSGSGELAFRYFKWLLNVKHENVLNIDPSLFKAISQGSSEFIIDAVEQIILLGQDEDLMTLMDDPDWDKNAATDPRAQFVEWIPATKMQMES